MSYLLDTNIVSAVLKRNRKALNAWTEAIDTSPEIFISCMTFYEIKRGLLYTNASSQLRSFDHLCRSNFQIVFLDNSAIIERACEIHVELRRKGRPIQDADTLIAATAMVNQLTLVSNDADLLNITGLTLENWLAN